MRAQINALHPSLSATTFNILVFFVVVFACFATSDRILIFIDKMNVHHSYNCIDYMLVHLFIAMNRKNGKHANCLYVVCVSVYACVGWNIGILLLHFTFYLPLSSVSTATCIPLWRQLKTNAKICVCAYDTSRKNLLHTYLLIIIE